MSRTNLAFIGLDAGRFGGWLARFPSAPVVVRDTLGLDLDNHCLEIPVRDGGSGTLDLLKEDRVLPFLNAHHVSHLVVFKPSHRVQVWAESQGLRLVGGDVSLAQRLENKVQFTQMAAEFGLPVPPTDILTAPFPSWSDWVCNGENRPSCRERADIPVREHSWSIPRRSCGSFLPGVVGGNGGVSFPGWKHLDVQWNLAKEGTAQLGPLYQQRTGDPRCTPKSWVHAEICGAPERWTLVCRKRFVPV